MEQPEHLKLSSWVRAYTGDLLQWATVKTSDHTLAEDLVQDTFLAAAEQIEKFRQESHPRTWLFGILRNKIADHYRKTLRERERMQPSAIEENPYFENEGQWKSTTIPQPWPDEEPGLLDQPAFTEVLRRCLEMLNPVMSDCIRMRFLEEQKGEVICQELGMTATNYWQVIHRAKLNLRNCLDKNWFRESEKDNEI
ncbi:MAG: sigma-70 family RNA polymerase sigma factor [Saprospiraceae bacterium]|nr:sigma-70 family RNA polymerase sigma factor [Saprospiraceae bacterium]